MSSIACVVFFHYYHVWQDAVRNMVCNFYFWPNLNLLVGSVPGLALTLCFLALS